MKTEKIELKHINVKVAKKLLKDLEKKLAKADAKKVFQYDINAHYNFCIEIIQMMDIMVGQVRKKYEKI